MSEAAAGGSSAMPQKRNPVGSVVAGACARLVRGHAAVLTAAMSQEHERGIGGWHAEWAALSGALAFCGGAVSAARRSLDGLVVDAQRMREKPRADGRARSSPSAWRRARRGRSVARPHTSVVAAAARASSAGARRARRCSVTRASASTAQSSRSYSILRRISARPRHSSTERSRHTRRGEPTTEGRRDERGQARG